MSMDFVLVSLKLSMNMDVFIWSDARIFLVVKYLFKAITTIMDVAQLSFLITWNRCFPISIVDSRQYGPS